MVTWAGDLLSMNEFNLKPGWLSITRAVSDIGVVFQSLEDPCCG
jgi:hypothetical protein